MDILHNIIFFLVAIIVLVTVHEWGHFFVARLCGIKVLRFSVGFGSPLFKWTDKKGTEFAVAPIPLGGYVKMLDEREGEVAPEELHLAFTRKSPWQRIAVASAGPIVNFVLAILLFWLLMATQGRSGYIPYIEEVTEGSIADQARLEAGQEIVSIDGELTPTMEKVAMQLLNRWGETGTIEFGVRYPKSDNPALIYQSDAQLNEWMAGVDELDLGKALEGIGLKFSVPDDPLMGKVVAGGAADIGGLKQGDLVRYADNTPINTWEEWISYIQARPDTKIDVTVLRAGKQLRLSITPQARVNDATGEATGYVGIWNGYISNEEFGVLEAFPEGIVETKNTISNIFINIKKLIFGEISTKNLAGVITIAKVAGSTASYGWDYYIEFLAFLSVMLGVVNLLPVPVLDGGQIIYYLVEALKGSPMSERTQMIGYQVGFFMIIGVMLLALYNDILRL